jgi:hypothetical protein
MSGFHDNALIGASGQQGYQISRSVRLRSSASAYFGRTFGAASGSTRGTWAGWVKRGKLGTSQMLWSASNYEFVQFMASDKLRISNPSGTPYWDTTMVFRDPSAWYHIVIAFDTTLATAADRCRLWVNGVQITQWDASATITQNTAFSRWNVNGQTGSIGRFDFNGTSFFDGYQTEIHWIDGQALTPSSFGETDAATGVWKPKRYAGTYGTNGFYLNFSDNSAATAATIGKDYSGNGNNWTPNNISVTAGVTYDSMLDVPTQWADGGNGRGNYAVLNPIGNNIGFSVTNGNISIANGSTPRGTKPASFFTTSGKWYWEITGNGYAGAVCGTNGASSTLTLSATGSNGIGYWEGGLVYWDGGNSGAGPASYTSSDVIGVALDMDAGTVAFYKNNSLQYTATFGSGTVPDLSEGCFPCYNDGSSASAKTANFNFGQRPFAYTPPTGFKALNTQNLPTPTISNGAQYMAATTYTGNGTTQSISNAVNGVSFQPDFVWFKNRSGANNHALYDSVRGRALGLISNATNAEQSASAGNDLVSFDSNGVSLGPVEDFTSVNGSAQSIVAWQWKANGTPAVTNTAGSITSQVSAGANQGFSIVTYTGTGSTGTVGHGLGVAPKMVIVKPRVATTTTDSWLVGHASLSGGFNDYLELNNTNAKNTASNRFNNTAPTSSVFTVGTAYSDNTKTYVAYLFSEVAGFSKFGSYTGNGSADGPFVFCGFRPRFILIKESTPNARGWRIFDTARSPFNQAGLTLSPNAADAEDTGSGLYNQMDILSNGFKLRAGTNSEPTNESGATYIFAAFAESPFKNALAR